MNVLIVCGGTGGHLFPGLAVGEELLLKQHKVLLVVSQKEIDQKALQNNQKFLVESLPAVGWGGLRPDRVFRFGVKMLLALLQARNIFRKFQPDVVLGMGGFSSIAPLFLARIKKIPICIHESNVIAGKANRFLSRWASCVAVGFDEARKQFPQNKAVWTGTPIRAALRVKKEHSQARTELGFAIDCPTILVMGGSQGAKGLNQLVTEAAVKISSLPIQWLHLSGNQDEAKVRKKYEDAGKKAQVYAFYHEMERLYAAADLVIARSGAASLAEIIQWSLPCILIPFPFAADKHQSANARLLVDADAAVMREEAECTPEQLAGEIESILIDKNRLKKMANATEKMQYKDAHTKLADLMEKLGGQA